MPNAFEKRPHQPQKDGADCDDDAHNEIAVGDEHSDCQHHRRTIRERQRRVCEKPSAFAWAWAWPGHVRAKYPAINEPPPIPVRARAEIWDLDEVAKYVVPVEPQKRIAIENQRRDPSN